MSRRSPSHLAAGRTRVRVPRWLKITVIVTLVLANAAAASVVWLVDRTESAFREHVAQLPEVVGELTERVEPSEPMFLLLIGSDSREGVDTDVYGDFGGERSDVVMLARLDPASGTAQLLSIPRDTWVPIEGHGEDKINAAFSYGGASLMVETVRETFDVPVHHYVEVDFAGFQELVDELGGVAMSFDHPARDPKSHLDVPAGAVTLDGEQALAYARSRSYQELREGGWTSVDADDIGRAARQQELVLAILSELKRPSTIAESSEIVTSIARHLTVDAALAESSLAGLALEFRSVAGADVETATLPTVGSTEGGASVQIPDQPAARAVLDAFRSGRPMDVTTDLDSVSVRILNGNGVAGSAQRWAAELERAGFEVAGISNAADVRSETVVRVEGEADRAEDVVEALGFGRVETAGAGQDVDAVVILGTDAETGTS